MLKGIIFDLDSTLIQAQIDFVDMKKHMIKLLEEHGHPKGELSPRNQTTVQIMECAREAWDQKDNPRDERQAVTDGIEKIMNRGELDAVVNLSEIEGASEAITALKKKGLKRSWGPAYDTSLRGTGMQGQARGWRRTSLASAARFLAQNGF